MGAPPLIYCASGNPRFTQIATDAGWLYGAQLPGTVYTHIAPLFFVDQNWKIPQREIYMDKLKEHHPPQATVLDLEHTAQLSEVLEWAEEAAQFVQRVVIIPKVFGIIPHIPARIGGADVVLGYSVPTKYAGTQVPVWEFARRPVHLLGGSPQRQISLRYYLNVISADGSYASKMATRYCQFWTPGNALAKDRYWPRLIEANGVLWNDGGRDAPYEAFRRSCANIMAAWQQVPH